MGEGRWEMGEGRWEMGEGGTDRKKRRGSRKFFLTMPSLRMRMYLRATIYGGGIDKEHNI